MAVKTLNRETGGNRHTPPAPRHRSVQERTAPLRPFEPNYFFLPPTTASLAALATRNFTTVLAAIFIASPVAGLRPIRALRLALTSRPMPGRTKTPFFFVSVRAVFDNSSRNIRA